MKKMNKFLSLLLAVIMVMSLAVTGFAADSYNIVITDVENEEYVYEAYQIFDGTLTVDAHGVTTLSDITWGSSIAADKQAALLDALKALEVDGAKPFKDCATAADVAEVLGQNTTKDNNVAAAFADTVGAVVEDPDATNKGDLIYLSNPSTASTYSDHTATITVTEPGYYMVRNKSIPSNLEDYNAAYTRYMLEVVHDVKIKHKSEVPTVDKDILIYEYETDSQGRVVYGSDGKPSLKKDADGNPILVQKVDENQASIGDTIFYELEGTLPEDIAAYDTYFYKFSDTMSSGLTLDLSSVKVTVNGHDVTTYFYKSGTVKSDGSTDLVVSIKDLLQLENVTSPAVGNITKDTKVVVTYTATLNDNAVVAGEKNSVDLTYSNNPHWDGEPSDNPPPPPGETPPTPSYPTGVTPPSEVITYTTEITITKKDESNQKLTGAAFKITGTSLHRVVTTGWNFVLSDVFGAGETRFYKLADGSFTDDAPVFVDDPATTDKDERTYLAYDHTYFVGDVGTDPTTVYAKTFKKVDTTTIEYVETQVDYESFVDDNGLLKLHGLGEGTYTITETVTPVGYNSIDPFTITITYKGNGVWEYTGTDYDDANGNGAYDAGEVFTNNVTVINRAGATLPSTGGMGTTLFYALGGVLVLAAVVLLVSKKRMSAE